MTAHYFAEHFDVRRAIAGKDVRDFPEVARAQQTRTDDCEETGVNVTAVTESVDHAPRYEESLAPVRPRIELLGGRHDWRTQARGVRRDGELPYNIGRLWSAGRREAGRNARDDRGGCKVHEDMPCLSQHDGILAAHALRSRDGQCDGDGAL
jgi:hypothetical protein